MSSQPTFTYIPEEADMPYEEDVLRNPYSLKSWWRFIEFKQHSPPRSKNLIFERALREIPGSYKIWFLYLRSRVVQVRGKCITDHAWEVVNNTFERSLVFMHKMPKIWVEYLKFLIEQRKISRIRHTFDRALRALPVLQHSQIWPLYIHWVREIGVPLSAMRVYKRYLKAKVEPSAVEDYIEYLVQEGMFNEAAFRLAKVVQDDEFSSKQGKSKHELWMQLCDVISMHAQEIKSVKVEPIIRTGIAKYSNEVGKLWSSLAGYYIALGLFNKARDVFEEGMDTVTTVRDFGLIWDAYTKFEDKMINLHLELLQTPGEDVDEEEEEKDKDDFDLRVARYEDLIGRQPLLISSVLLRQNPHNVYEWRKRVILIKKTEDPNMIVSTYTEALKTIDPQKATGKPHLLWASFARFYDSKGEHESACKIFEKGCQQKFKYVDDLASLWCDYIEMEIRHQNYEKARELCQKATTSPRGKPSVTTHFTKILLHKKTDNSVQKWLFKSIKIWLLYADLEESFGTFQTAKAVYEKIIDLRIATPQIIINYAAFLEEHNYFEESFKAFERGVNLFNFPHAMPIWLSYLTKFVERYGGKKLERARDLFEQVLEKVPAKDAKIFYIMYAALEEEFGLSRHAMAVYDRATRGVAEEDRYKMYLLYINRAGEYFGVMKTRDIYEKAIEALPEKYIKDICLRFANLERRLGEIDRARAIYTHVSQFCDPRSDTGFWDVWREFEIQHGNNDTFREMLRIRRSVQALYNTQVNFSALQMSAATQAANAELAGKRPAGTTMEQLERTVIAEAQDSQQTPENSQKDRKNLEFVVPNVPAAVKNPEAVELMEEEPAKPAGPVDVEEKSIPQAVFGSLGLSQETIQRVEQENKEARAAAAVESDRKLKEAERELSGEAARERALQMEIEERAKRRQRNKEHRVERERDRD